MSTTMIYKRIDENDVRRIKGRPLDALDIVLPKLPPPEEPAKESGSFLSRLFKKSPTPPPPQPLVDWKQVYENPDVFDLDKAAEGLHFLLTGGGMPYETETEKWWLCPIGTHFLEESEGKSFEPPMFLIENDEVGKFHAALEALTKEKMTERFEPKVMMEMPIYPDIWDRDPAEDDTLGWLVEMKDKFVPFLEETKNSEKALVGTLIY